RGTTYDRGTGAGTNAGDQKVDPSTTFQIKGPALTPSLKQGEKKNVNLTLDRGNNFKDSVKLSAEAPKGLKVEFAKPTVVAGDPADTVMSIEADKDAPAAEHVVRVTATPGMGKPTMLDVKVKVEQVK
nr:hypothetical protein [Fimbriiglobus sp.]